METKINAHSVKGLQQHLTFKGRLLTRLCNFLFRIFKVRKLEIMFIQIPENMSRDYFLADFMVRVGTPLEKRVVKEEPPYCCAGHILEYIAQKKHCYLPDEKMQQYYSICIKEEEYEIADIIKQEADRRLIPLQK